VLARVVRDLGRGDEQVERLRLGHLRGGELARQPLAQLLGVSTGRDRPQRRLRRRLRREPAQHVVRVLEVPARRPAVAGDDLRMGAPDAVENAVGQAVHVVRAQHPHGEMGERAVEDRLVPDPDVPLVAVGAALDVGDRAQRRGPCELPRVDLVVGGQGVGRPRVGRAVVEERHVRRVGAERLAHRRQARAGVGDDRPLALLEPRAEERDRPRDVLVLPLVEERVVTEACQVLDHRSGIRAHDLPLPGKPLRSCVKPARR
jgi:hypothetical protein